MNMPNFVYCPIHPKFRLQHSTEKYGRFKGDPVAWCPKCDVKFPIGLSYTELIQRHIQKLSALDSFGAQMQTQDMILKTVKAVLQRVVSEANEQLDHIWEKMQKVSNFAWTMMAEIPFYKSKLDAVDYIMGALGEQDLSDWWEGLEV